MIADVRGKGLLAAVQFDKEINIAAWAHLTTSY
jgi:4-aminobutyrate aminotransferase-like enzyme